MDRVLAIDRELRRLGCPLCGAAALQVVVRCELAYGECRHTVKCGACGVVFELSSETWSPRLFQPDLHTWLSLLRCEACGGQGAELRFRCDLPARECFYLVRCRSCGREFRASRVPTAEMPHAPAPGPTS